MLETFGQEGTRARLLGYWLGLQDLGLAEVQQAVATLIATSSRLPVPAEVRQACQGGSTEDLAIAAWSEVLKAMPLGSYKSVDFEDRAINATIRVLGGWPAALESCGTTEDEKWYRLNFLKAYQSFRRQGCDGEAGACLPGLGQAEVRDGVLQEPVPRRIACDPSRANLPRIPNKPSQRPAIESAGISMDGLVRTVS